MQIPCKSHFPPIPRNGPETDLERIWNGFEVNLKQMKNTSMKNFFLNTKSTKETKSFVCSVYSVFKGKINATLM